MVNTKEALIFTYAHLPEKFQFLSNPPEDITEDKYNDIGYLERVIEMIEELKESDFDTRSDGVLPYSKEVIISHIKKRIECVKRGDSDE